MPRKRFSIVFSIVVLLTLFLVGQASAAPGDTTRVSVASDGTQGNWDSGFYGTLSAISANGRYVAFDSYATNLVTGDVNGAANIFLRDRETNTTMRISVASDGTPGDSNSYSPAISADGRYVVFASFAGNLDCNPNGTQDIFIHDRQTNTTVCLISPGNVSSGLPAISADGRYVTFSSGDHYVIGDTNGAWDVFLVNRQTSTTTRISLDSDGIEGNGDSFGSSLSVDGRYVAFDSDASNLVAVDSNGATDVFLRDTNTNTTTRLSLASDGAQSNGNSGDPTISADGRYVVFISDADNLVSGDTNGTRDIFLRDTQTNTTTRISVASDGIQANNTNNNPAISANGRYVVFASDASNLVAGDTNGASDIFLRDTQTNTTTRISVASDGTQTSGNSFSPTVSADGGFVVFSSDASNLVAGDTNGATDVFVHENGSPVITHIFFPLVFR